MCIELMASITYCICVFFVVQHFTFPSSLLSKGHVLSIRPHYAQLQPLQNPA